MILVDDGDEPWDGIEHEADELAGSWCLPKRMGPPAQPRRAWVTAEAERQGVHPVMVVGRLQHDGIIDWKSELVRGAPRVDDLMAAWT